MSGQTRGSNRSALASFAEIVGLTGGNPLLVALDFDGTLTPIVERPELALLSEEMRSTMDRLSRLCPVAVISGRGLDDIKHLVGLDRLYYAGSHGFEVMGPEGTGVALRKGVAFLPVLDEAERQLNQGLKDLPGLLVERKRFSVAVHYRQVPANFVPRVKSLVESVLSGLVGLRKAEGKKVLELRPEMDWDKGKALLWLTRTLDQRNVSPLFPIYVGDDLTDEDAFRAVQGRGAGILVRGKAEEEARRFTAATYELADCSEVGLFLERLCRTMRERSS